MQTIYKCLSSVKIGRIYNVPCLIVALFVCFFLISGCVSQKGAASPHPARVSTIPLEQKQEEVKPARVFNYPTKVIKAGDLYDALYLPVEIKDNDSTLSSTHDRYGNAVNKDTLTEEQKTRLRGLLDANGEFIVALGQGPDKGDFSYNAAKQTLKYNLDAQKFMAVREYTAQRTYLPLSVDTKQLGIYEENAYGAPRRVKLVSGEILAVHFDNEPYIKRETVDGKYQFSFELSGVEPSKVAEVENNLEIFLVCKPAPARNGAYTMQVTETKFAAKSGAEEGAIRVRILNLKLEAVVYCDKRTHEVVKVVTY